MSIDINNVAFKVNGRWIEIWVGEQEVLSIDTTNGGVELCPSDSTGEIGNLVANEYGTFKFEPADEECDDDDDVTPIELRLILKTLARIEKKL